MDAGNVWFWDARELEDPRVVLSADNLELGIAAGIGFRFNFDFLILALDLGQQLYAPDLRGWVTRRLLTDLGADRLQYNLGIGYPF